MNDKNKQTLQKLRGGYYTPIEIAEFLTTWAIEPDRYQKILEPSAGDGVFIESLKGIDGNIDVTAVEILEEEASKIVRKTEDFPNFKVENIDFYDFYEEFRSQKLKGETEGYDVVLGNPPYIRYQYLTKEQRDFQSDILENNGVRSNKLINAWMAFTIASVEMVKEEGKIAFILPTDLLQVSYAKQLRDFLFNSLSSLTIITFDELVFEGIQQDVVLLLGEKNILDLQRSRTHNLRIINLENSSGLNNDIFNVPFDQYTSYGSEKWTKFYLSREERIFYELDFPKFMKSFNEFAKGEIGVTTGNNNFFVVNNSIVQSYDLQEYARPLLGRSIEVNGVFYEQKDLEKNISANQKVWMLDFNGKELSRNAQNYIDYGIENGENNGYKLSLRKRWFDIPSIWVPDAFMLRRIGEFPRIVKNEIQATSTDTFHRIKFREGINISKFLFLMYSSPTLLTFELEGRIFGGGALEILPGDLINVKIPIVDDLLNYDQLLKELDDKLRGNIPIVEISSWVNEQIRQHTTFSENQLDNTFLMWRKLNEKRIAKGKNKTIS
ncbi:class I SAM-dependent methyltransferase [Enterococcus faecalis]|nr:class I SAM-dependent methyltransferase [Enterococcus faecalis]EGS1161915.1 class I SAM-dependent methyltransferase [Enterococcus faecalis]EKF8803169.1 class I SAM-dependent methyltransferase [Enterococcus faecalis]EKO5930553.1 class I SAM-dependent methyltransferase [Enterococcus faecalis]EKQ3643835.1 class I SAM-dependent methyltransferase [Enterococcus faecalis]